jgi:uncharacterized protein YfaS (alpha-2-macroglobulin family)
MTGEDDTVEWGIYFWGGFAPETAYELTFRKGMPDIFGQALAEDLTFRFRTGPFRPVVWTDSPGGVMESAFPALVPVTVRNMPRAEVYGKVMTDAQTASLLAAWPAVPGRGNGVPVPDKARPLLDAARGPGEGNGRMTVVPRADSSKEAVTEPVSLAELTGGRDRDGVVLVGAGEGDGWNLFQVTDLALTAKLGRTDSVVWVTSLSAGLPVGGATVTALDCGGGVLWSGETGPDGTVRFPGADEIAGRVSGDCRQKPTGHPDVHFSASKGGSRVFWSLGWTAGFHPYHMGVEDYRNPLSGDWAEAFLITSQPLYRPGETARLKIVARVFAADGFAAPESGRVRVIVQDPEGGIALDTEADMGPFGTVPLDVPVPRDAPQGRWRVLLDLDPAKGRTPERISRGYWDGDSCDAGSFGVSSYRLPAFDLELGGLGDAVFGDRARFTARGEYHYGGPVSGGTSDFELFQSPLWNWAPPGFDGGWSFTARSAVMRDLEGGWSYEPAPPGMMADGRAPADADGTASFEAVMPAGWVPVPREVTLTATARDADSRTVSRSGTFTAYPASVAVGLRPQLRIAGAGSPVEFQAIVTDALGKARPGTRVTLRLWRRTWSSARRLVPGGYYSQVPEMTDTLVSEKEIVSGEVPLDASMVPSGAGEHYVSAEAADPEGRKALASFDFSAAGEGAAWRTPGEEGVELAADRSLYRPGDTARVIVRSPFGEGTGLLTVERGGVREARTFDLAGGSPVLDIPVSRDSAPLMHVSVMLVRGRTAPPPARGPDLGKPAFRRGYLALKVAPDMDTLDVRVTPGSPSASPGGEARVKVRVTGHDGQPYPSCEVALAVVDAGLVQIAGDDGYRPEALMRKPVPLRVKTATSLAAVLDVIDWAGKGPAGPAGGGGGYMRGRGGEPRSDFRTAAFFAPALEPDGNGELEAVFTLPDSLTAYRIYAVATGPGRATGTGEASFTVTSDLVMRASLPGHLTDGDLFEASAIVASRASAPGELAVEIRPRAGMELLEPARKTVRLAPGESVEVSFRARAVMGAGQAGTRGTDAGAGGGLVPGAAGTSGRNAGAGAGHDPDVPGASGLNARAGAGHETDVTGASGPDAGAGNAPDGAVTYDQDREGTLEVEFEAVLDGGEGEALSDRALFTVPLGRRGRIRTDASFSRASPGDPMPEAALPGGADPGRGGLELTFTSGMDGLLEAPLRELENYPWDCTEQIVSRAAGALYGLRIERARRDGDLTAGSPEARARRLDVLGDKVTGALKLIASRSREGGFTSWPGGHWLERSPVLAAWVLDFLVEAGEDGFGEGEALRSSVVSYLETELANATPGRAFRKGATDEASSEDASAGDASVRESSAGQSCRLCGDDDAQLYVMGALFRAGRPREGTLEPIYAGRASLGPAGRILLLRALCALPPTSARVAQVEEMARSVASELEISGVTARVSRPGGSELAGLWLQGRDDLGSLALLALSEADPAHPLIPALAMGTAVPGRVAYGTNRAVTLTRGLWKWLYGAGPVAVSVPTVEGTRSETVASDVAETSGPSGAGEGSGPSGAGEGSGPSGAGEGSGPSGAGEGSRSSGPSGSGEGSGPSGAGDGSGSSGAGEGSGSSGAGEGSGSSGTGDGAGPVEPAEGSRVVGAGDGAGPVEPAEGSRAVGAGEASGPAVTGEDSGPVERGEGSGPAERGEGSGPTEPGEGSGPSVAGGGSGPVEPVEASGPDVTGESARQGVSGAGVRDLIPDLGVSVLSGDRTVMQGRLAGPRSPALRAWIPARELAGGALPSWKIEGTGELWSFRRLSWAPVGSDLSAVGTRGLVLTRSYQRLRPEPGPHGESVFRRGEVVKVTVTIMTTVPRWNLALEDPVPAGLEPMDFGMRDQNQNLARLLAGSPGPGDPWVAWLNWHDREEIRPESVRLFAGYLEPGVYSYSYLTRPVTPGTYPVEGPYAEEMYAPENHGRGVGVTITVER